MEDGTVKVRSQVKYGRRFNYPANRAAELFCQLTRTPGQEVAKSLTDWQLDVIRELGHEVEATTEIVRRNRPKRTPNNQ